MATTFTQKQMRLRVFAALTFGIFAGLIVTYGTIKLNSFTLNELINRDKDGGEVPVKEAMKSLDAYRKKRALLSMGLFYGKHKLGGLLHSTESMDKLYKHFNDFKANHPPREGYEWAMGLYPCIVKVQKEDSQSSGTIPRLCIYFIPTMQKIEGSRTGKAEDDILDYFLNSDAPEYEEPTKDPTQKPAEKSPVYDQGTLFP